MSDEEVKQVDGQEASARVTREAASAHQVSDARATIVARKLAVSDPNGA